MSVNDSIMPLKRLVKMIKLPCLGLGLILAIACGSCTSAAINLDTLFEDAPVASMSTRDLRAAGFRRTYGPFSPFAGYSIVKSDTLVLVLVDADSSLQSIEYSYPSRVSPMEQETLVLPPSFEILCEYKTNIWIVRHKSSGALFQLSISEDTGYSLFFVYP